MNENQEVPTAPAQAVEANTGTPEGAAHTATPQGDSSATNENQHASGSQSAHQSEQARSGSDGPEGDAPEGADGEDAGDDHEEGGEPQVGADGVTDPTKKKRRRRRKKKPGLRADGTPIPEGEAPPEGGQGQSRPPREQRPAREPREQRPGKEGQGGVFARFFDGPNGGKRHAFAAGEVVAGRVVRINEGAFAVDLFGKATAFVDIFEPHEVPVVPEPPPPPAAEPIAPASAWGVPGADASPAGEAVAEAAPAEASAESAPVEGADAPPASELAADQAAVSPEPAPVEAETVAAQAAELASEAAIAPALDVLPQAEASAPEHGEEAHGEEHAAEAHGEESHAEEDHAEAEAEPAPPPPPEMGSIFRGRIGSVAESGHVVLVNRIIESPAAKKRIAAARDAKQRVRGLVYGFNRGGFDVLVEGIRVFCPASGMALSHVENPEDMLGQRLEFTVPPAKPGGHGLVVSRRGILERQQRKNAKKLFRTLTPGQRLTGRVTQVREFGVFVDLGGIEGLVHQSELSFARGVRPEEVCKPGDEVQVQVLRVGEGQTRKERERVSLSMKALQEDPWSQHRALLEPGNVITGKVVRTTDFGAFIELAPQIEGLLHISEIGRDLKHANQALNEGDEIKVVVERSDHKARRISLSKLSQSEEKSLEAGQAAGGGGGRAPKPGATLKVVVDKIEQMGLIVQIPGVFGRRGRGFIPNVEMGTERGTDHRRQFPQGTEITVKAIGVDRDGGFRFSRKALMVDEEKRAVQDYRREAARQGFGTFGDLLRQKLEGSK